MAGYGLSLLDHDRHIGEAVVIECDADEAACDAARTYRDGRAMELWLLDRLVRSWPADDPS